MRKYHKIAITGSNGFIGQRLLHLLNNMGYEVITWNRPYIDLLDYSETRDAVLKASPCAIIHLAATGISHSRTHDIATIHENIKMTANILTSCPKETVIILAGSMSEYGRSGTLREDDRCDPTTAYGIGKLAATNYALAYGSRKELSLCVARIFGVYGPGEADQRLFPTLLRNLREGTKVPLSDGLQHRDFIHVDDVSEGLARLLEASAGNDQLIINLGTGVAPRIRDVAHWIVEALGADERLLDFGARERSPGDADMIVADVNRLRKKLGWVPPQRLIAGIDIARVFN